MKVKRKKLIYILGVLFLALPLFSSIALNASAVENTDNSAQINSQNVGSSAECMALLEVSTGRVLYEKNAYKKRAMASTTKIMTAITVIENTRDLDKIIKVPAAAVGIEGSSIYLVKDEELSVLDLLYGLMLQSGNDCAEALAILTSQNKQNFAALMNETAKKIGAVNSNFVTPHGLDAEGHYTTAYDLALISAYALKNPVFAKIVSTKKHTTNWKGRDYKRVIINKNRLLNSYDGCDGVKTGYTKKAGRCYVSSATRNGMQVVCAVLNCGPMFEECASFMSRAFEEYEMTQVLFAYKSLGQVNAVECRKDKIDAGVLENTFYPLTKYERDNLRYEVKIEKSIEAPAKIGNEIGRIYIYNQNNLLFEEKLYNIEAAESKNLADRLKEMLEEWVS